MIMSLPLLDKMDHLIVIDSFLSWFSCMKVTLEAEVTNKGALALYGRLGFIRAKRLFRYYLNGVDAFRLKLLFPSPTLLPGADKDGTSHWHNNLDPVEDSSEIHWGINWESQAPQFPTSACNMVLYFESPVFRALSDLGGFFLPAILAPVEEFFMEI